MDDTALAWTAVVPVKALSAAKSRLADAATAQPPGLALAFLQDTLAALAGVDAVDRIVVVTRDEQVRQVATAAGCRVVADEDHPGINAAAAWGAAHAEPGTAVAVVVSDLPALTPAALASVLACAGRHRTAFLADADGVGTTMWFAAPGIDVRPRFGDRSRAAHAEDGAVDLVAAHPDEAGSWSPARADVDTPEALTAAVATGVGRHTAAALDGGGARLLTVISRDGDAVACTDEDGAVEVLPWPLVAAAGLRDVRTGQRLVAVGGRGEGGSLAVRLPA